MKIMRTVEGTLSEVIALDAVISSSVSQTVTLTEHPIEDGSTIVDHARKGPLDLTVTGLVSNTPITQVGFGVIPNIDNTRRQTAYRALIGLADSKESVQIEDVLDLYTDMVLVDLQVPRNRTNFHALEFTATFRKIVKAGLKLVELKDEEQTKALATPAASAGRVAADESSTKAGYQGTLLWQGLKYVGAVQ